MPNEPQVQRYDASHGVERHELGDYVAWDDYDALAVQVAALTERARSAERECAALRADVGFEESILRIHRATSGTDA